MKKKIYNIIIKSKILHAFYNNLSKKKNRLRYHLYNKNALLKMKTALENHNIDFWLDYGTLLGVIRSNSIISYDNDLDVGIFYFKDNDIIEKILIDAGFTKVRDFIIDGKIVEETYQYKGVDIDIFYYFKNQSNPIEVSTFYFTFMNKNKMSEDSDYIIQTTKVNNYITNLIDYSCLGAIYKIPENYKQYLTENYGENYMIPNPNWNSLNDPTNIVICKEILAKCRYYTEVN